MIYECTCKTSPTPFRILNLHIDSSNCSPMSDHFLITFSLDGLKTPKLLSKDKPASNYNFKKANFNSMSEFFICQPKPACSVHLEKIISRAQEIFVPKFNSQKSKSPKWYTTEMRHTINRCKTLTRRNKSKPTESTSLRLSNLSTHLQELMTTAKSEYEKSLAVCFKFNPSKLFRHLRDLSKKSPQTRTIIHNGSIITETGQIAEIFNKYFNSTFTRSDYTLPPWDKMPSPTYQLSSISIEESEVYETLTSLDTTKSPGHDNINASTLKCCATALTRSVTHIFNSSLSSHTFPPHWKVHKICPIPKKGDPHLVENFRPISLLPIISKVFETIIYKKIITFVRPKITCQQFGFLRNRSCLSQLILFFSQVFDNIENRKPTDVNLPRF